MSLASIGTLCGMSPRVLYETLRIGEVSATYSDTGKLDDEIAEDIGVEQAIHTRARSLYKAIALGRALGEKSALQSLDTLVSGIESSDIVPTILPSLPAIKLRLGMSVAYNDTQAMSPNIEQTRDIAITSTNRLSLHDLQQRRDSAIESARLLSTGSSIVVENESIEVDHTSRMNAE